ncbi:unnamed protein product [Rotaria sp. Silwood2]|nr:unnamed protein product [Rotaria sp. Silwood2]CAF2944879.1 unnamed protein product [Rotaria sp. Silwood2]CAF4382243.1 unnamed protein product [Rotaria sp. Silwood2]CAF4436037.1 unnamed protein product [Rotaria sp. Silwood2]
MVQQFGAQLINKAIDLLRGQNDELKQKNYFMEELEDNRWEIGQKDEEKNHFITSSIIYRDSYEHLQFCDCELNDEIFDQANRIQEMISINKRWLKATVDHYLNEVAYYDNN